MAGSRNDHINVGINVGIDITMRDPRPGNELPIFETILRCTESDNGDYPQLKARNQIEFRGSRKFGGYWKPEKAEQLRAEN
jgi:hypothetical protein